MRAVRVLIVDDSMVMRDLLTHLLSREGTGIEVIGTAEDPYEARELIKQLNPDVITLDIEMPKMDGLEFLEKIMRLRPMPVVMVSSLTQKGADAALQAMELGAVDCVAKASSQHVDDTELFAQEVIYKLKAAAHSRLRRERWQPTGKALTFDRSLASHNLIAIGASTGGVEALRSLLSLLPENSPPVVVTQHMPEYFTQSFADRLNTICKMTVKEAEDKEKILPGHCYIARGGMHFEVKRVGFEYSCRLIEGPLVSGHRPSVDVLFNSVAQAAGDKAVGAILTGMGSDGAKGLLAMRNKGATTFGQDEDSCVVYGMPKAAKALGAVETELPLAQIPFHLLSACMSARQHRKQG